MTKHLEIRLSGSGGQGLLLSARILAQAFASEGASVSQSQSYEPTSRGGLSRADLVIDGVRPDFPLAEKLDYLLVLHQCAAGASDEIINDDMTALIDSELVTEPPAGKFKVKALPLTRTAREIGNVRIANIVALGALAGLSRMIDRERLEDTVRKGVPPKFLDLNLEALEAGYRLAEESRDN
ncbi:MAG: pyruvate ferredoxin oxidoreductase [Hyphomicrobiales bacterium]|nr:MAG: pyruvate ferredoxin oxidoreductase [Hyphomicrobiales bacterium]